LNRRYILSVKIDQGRLSSWYRRARERFGNLQTVMIIVIFLSTAGWRWWYPLILLGFALFIVYDIRYILPKETEYDITRSRSFVELTEMVKRIEDKING